MKKNLTLKILAVVVTIFIWVQAMLLKQQSTDVDLPVKLTNVPDQLAFKNSVTQSVHFHVEGRGIDILLLKLAHTYVEIDAQDLKYRNNIIPLNKYQINLPKYITLTEIRPLSNDVIRFETDIMMKKTVPIILQFSSQDVENKFRQMSLIQNISYTEITGAQSIINKIAEIKTQPISDTMLNGSAFTVDLISPSKSVVLIQKTVHLQLGKMEFATRTISMIPIQTKNKAITTIPALVSVKIQGARSDLDQITVNDIQAVIKTDKIGLNQMVPVQVTISKPAHLIEYTPHEVRIQKND